MRNMDVSKWFRRVVKAFFLSKEVYADTCSHLSLAEGAIVLHADNTFYYQTNELQCASDLSLILKCLAEEILVDTKEWNSNTINSI